MKVCVKAGRKVFMDSALHCEGAVLEIPDYQVEAMVADGSVEVVKAPKKSPAKKSPAKKSD